MSEIINAKGLACPQPVILTKKALDSHDELVVLVDNTTSLLNVKRFASSSGYAVDVTEESDGIFRIDIKKKQIDPPEYDITHGKAEQDAQTLSANGPTVFVISSNIMGYGNDELGKLLMKAFIHTAIDLERLPDIIILYNTGVKLAITEYGTVDDLKILEEKGVKILVCGTCVNFFELVDKISVGTLSNMYDIANTLSTAGRIVKP